LKPFVSENFSRNLGPNRFSQRFEADDTGNSSLPNIKGPSLYRLMVAKWIGGLGKRVEVERQIFLEKWPFLLAIVIGSILHSQHDTIDLGAILIHYLQLLYSGSDIQISR